jgi:hypothetical protein
MAEKKVKKIRVKVKKTIDIGTGVESSLDQIAILAIQTPSNAEIEISYKMVDGVVTKNEYITGGELSADQEKIGKIMYQEVIDSFKGLKDGKVTVKFTSIYEVVN